MWYNEYPKYTKEQAMKKLITLIMTFLLCLGSIAPTFAAEKKKGFDAAAKHAIAVEATTGKILYEKEYLRLISFSICGKISVLRYTMKSANVSFTFAIF